MPEIPKCWAFRSPPSLLKTPVLLVQALVPIFLWPNVYRIWNRASPTIHKWLFCGFVLFVCGFLLFFVGHVVLVLLYSAHWSVVRASSRSALCEEKVPLVPCMTIPKTMHIFIIEKDCTPLRLLFVVVVSYFFLLHEITYIYIYIFSFFSILVKFKVEAVYFSRKLNFCFIPCETSIIKNN